jgi:hypothetical protein
MTLTPEQLAFVEKNPAAAMITIGRDGFAKPARVGVGVVDGKLWSSGTADRVRTKRLRRDPRATLFVFDASGFAWLGIDADVSILDGPDAPAQNLRFMRQMQHAPSGPLQWFGVELDEAAFLQTMVDEQRVIYEMVPQRAYGMLAMPS